MLDANGNYVASRPTAPVAPAICSISWCTRSGAPSDTVGYDGDLTISRTTGTIYEKVSGTWVALPGGGGGGGGTNNQTGAGSPVGVNVPDYAGQFYTDTVSPYNVYVAVGATNADWVLVVGELT